MQTENSPPTIAAGGKPAAAGQRPAFAAWALGIAAALFGAGLCVNATPHCDLFWQLRAGHDILTTHAIPHADAYSYTRHGAPWVAHEWLAFALFAIAYAKAGFGGVWVVEALLVAATCAILYGNALREMRAPIPAFALTLVAELVCAPLLQARPHLFTYLGLAATCAVTSMARAGNPRSVYWLLPLFVLWANLHAGVVVGVAVLAVLAGSDWLQGRLGGGDAAQRRESGRHLAVAAALAGLATLATPYSWHVYQNIGATLGNGIAMDNVAEWKSPNFHLQDGRILEVFLGIVVCALIASRERRTLADIVLIAFFAHESLAALRNAPLLAIVAVSVAGRHVMSCLRLLLSRAKGDESESLFLSSRPPAFAALALVALVVMVSGMRAQRVVLLSPSRGAASGADAIARASFSVAAFPEGACRFVERESFPTTMRMYNSYDDGGYLIWRLPQFPVYADGRADLYFGPPLERIQALTRKMPWDWSAKVAQGTPDGALPDFALLGSDQSQTRLFLESPNWALVYADSADVDTQNDQVNNTLIFVRRTAASARLVQQCRADCPAVDAIRAAYPGYSAAQ